ncbi:MAG: hypothetical protein CMK59_10165 [Proteobacteria bacterium]|nr:hypothetical protein [Pseudomonadota bacterium]
MKIRTNYIDYTHQVFSKATQNWAQSSESNSFVFYLLEKGLIHLWLCEGEEAIRRRLIDIPFFVYSFRCQENPIWLLRCWMAISKKDVSPIYLSQVSKWTPSECEEWNDFIIELSKIYEIFGWNDADLIFEKQLLESYKIRFEDGDYRIRRLQNFIDMFLLPPHLARPKMERFLEWSKEWYPKENKDELIAEQLIDLSKVSYSEGNIQLATEYSEKAIVQLEMTYSNNRMLFLNKQFALVEFFTTIGRYAYAESIMEEWFQVCCIEAKEEDLTDKQWAINLSIMADFIKGDEPIRATEMYQDALEIVGGILGYTHSLTQDIIRNLAFCYADQGLLTKASELLSGLSDVLAERYHDHDSRVLDLDIDRGLIYQKNEEYWYIAAQVYESIIEGVLENEDNEHVFQRLYFCYSGLIKDTSNWGIEVTAEQKERAMDCFFEYEKKVKERYDCQSLKYKDLTLMKVEFLTWNEQYEEALSLVKRAFQEMQNEVGAQHSRMNIIRQLLIDIYVAQEEFQKAEKVSIEMVQSKQTINGLFHFDTNSARYQVFEMILKQELAEKARAWLEAWLELAREELHSEAKLWKDIYFWLASGFDDLQDIDRADYFYVQGCEHAELVFGLASDEHIDAMYDYQLFLASYDEREGFDTLFELLSFCEEHLGLEHQTTIKFREDCLDNNPKLSLEDWQAQDQMVRKQWGALKLTTSDFNECSDDVLLLLEGLLILRIEVCVALDKGHELRNCYSMTEELQRISFRPVLYMAVLRSHGLIGDWKALSKSLKHIQDEGLDVDLAREYIEDVLEEFDDLGLIKGVKILSQLL